MSVPREERRRRWRRPHLDRRRRRPHLDRRMPPHHYYRSNMPPLIGRIQLFLCSLFNWTVSYVQSRFEQPLRLSVEETGIVGVQAHLSVEESATERKQATLCLSKSSSLSGEFYEGPPCGYFQGSTINFSAQAKVIPETFCKEKETIEVEVCPRDPLPLLAEGKSCLNIVKVLDHGQQSVVASNSNHQGKKKKRWYRKRKPLEKNEHVCFEICYYPTMVMRMTKRALILISKAGRRKASNKLWILVLLQTFFTIISGHPSCEHIVNIPHTNHLTIQNSELDKVCDLHNLSFCPDMNQCLKGQMDVCFINNSAINISYSLENFGIYYLEYGTDSSKKVQLTDEDCKQINNSFADTSPTPSSESPSTTTVKVVTILCLIFGVLFLAVGYLLYRKYKDRCCQSVKESAIYVHRSSKSAIPDASTSEETSTSTSSMEHDAFIVQAEE